MSEYYRKLEDESEWNEGDSFGHFRPVTNSANVITAAFRPVEVDEWHSDPPTLGDFEPYGIILVLKDGKPELWNQNKVWWLGVDEREFIWRKITPPKP